MTDEEATKALDQTKLESALQMLYLYGNVNDANKISEAIQRGTKMSMLYATLRTLIEFEKTGLDKQLPELYRYICDIHPLQLN